jgi:hypothetical protein
MSTTRVDLERLLGAEKVRTVTEENLESKAQTRSEAKAYKAK